MNDTPPGRANMHGHPAKAIMIERSSLRVILIAASAGLVAFLINAGGPLAETAFSGVAAEDMNSNDTILWTRTVDPATGQPLATALTAQLAAEPEFRTSCSRTKAPPIPHAPGRLRSTRLV